MFRQSLIILIALCYLTVGFPTEHNAEQNENLITSNEQLQSADQSLSMGNEEINKEESTRAITDALTNGNAHILLGTFQAMMAPMPKGSDIIEMIKPIGQFATVLLKVIVIGARARLPCANIHQMPVNRWYGR
ncbi:hypothetical protein CBL_10080 [Carabus blaptoides fortunei]